MPIWKPPAGKVKLRGKSARISFEGIENAPRFCLDQRALAERSVRMALSEAAAREDGPEFSYDPASISPALTRCARCETGNYVEVPIELAKPVPAPAAPAAAGTRASE
jgi:hypothetical protein